MLFCGKVADPEANLKLYRKWLVFFGVGCFFGLQINSATGFIPVEKGFCTTSVPVLGVR